MPAATTNPCLSHTVSRRALIAGAGGFAGTLALATLPASQTRASFRREKPAPALETMIDILQQLPGSLAEMEEAAILFTHVDIAAQLEALDLPAYDPADGAPGKEYLNATSMLPLRMDPFRYALDDEFITLIGFHPFAVRQALQVGTGSSRITLIRGGFDPKTIHNTWESTGYLPMETSSGAPAWSSGPDGDFSPDDPLKRRTTGSMNNVTILDEEWLLFTRTFDQLDAIVTFASDTTADSLFAVPGVRDTIAMLNDETVAAIALPGSLLTPETTFPQGSAIPETLVNAEKEFGPLPAASLLLTAVTGGLRPIADGEEIDVLQDVVVQARLALREGSEDGRDAKAAAATIANRWDVLDSLATKVPYTEFLTVAEAGGLNTVAALDFTISGSPAFWSRMIDQRDWLPFVTTSED